MRVLVIGAGAIGSVLAAGISQGGGDVRLIARGRRLDWLLHHPLEIVSDGQVRHVAVTASDWSGLERPADLAILCTKTVDLAAALVDVAPCLAPGASIVTLQNGVEAPQMVVERLPASGVLAGRVHGFFTMEGQCVQHVGVAPTIALGGANERGIKAEQEVCQLIAKAGFACTVSSNIMRDLWEKLMLVASLGAVAAALHIPAGRVGHTAEGATLLREALSEVARVARACGISLGTTDIERVITFVRRFPRTATTSLQRDLNAGRPSEYDALVGVILRLAQSHGVAIPTFAQLDRELNARTATGSRGQDAAGKPWKA